MTRATGYIPRDYKSFPLGSDTVHTKQWDGPLLSLQEAAELAKDNVAKKLDPLSLCLKRNILPTYQNGYGYCWAAAATQCLMIVLGKEGQPTVRLSHTAMAAKIKNYRDRGGNAFEAFPFMAEHGLPTIDLWPENEVDKSLDTPEMRAQAKLRCAIEWFELPDNSDEHKWTAMANNFAIWSGYMNIGHAMCSARFELDNRGNPMSLDINSWNRATQSATQWDESWLGNKNTIYRRAGRDFGCFEQYALRVVTVAA